VRQNNGDYLGKEIPFQSCTLKRDKDSARNKVLEVVEDTYRAFTITPSMGKSVCKITAFFIVGQIWSDKNAFFAL